MRYQFSHRVKGAILLMIGNDGVRKVKILYVSTIAGTMSFFKEEFSHLKKENNEIDIACNMLNSISFEPHKYGINAFHVPFSRSPFSKDNIKAYKVIKQIIEEGKYDIVHCHTPNASAITRFACRKIRNNGTRVIYTAHGFHFYKGAPLINWLVYYPVEWLCSKWTDTLITINCEDYSIAKKRFNAKDIEFVPGVGINISKFESNTIDVLAKREELGLTKDATVLISVGELNKNKNHETVIRAIQGIDVYYLIVGRGIEEERLNDVISEVNMQERVKLLGFRTDIAELLQASDFFVFPSYREGLSVSLMEAMSCGKPIAASNIRGNKDLIDQNGGVLFNPKSIADCRNAIMRVLKSDSKTMGEYNKEKVKYYDISIVLKKIDEIYCKTTNK